MFTRGMISSTKPKLIPRGSLLYVPASSPKFLKSSLSSPSQTVTYDLEDSVHASAKASARQSLIEWLEQIPADGIQGKGLDGLSIAVRPNSPFILPEEEEVGDETRLGKDRVYETLREKSDSAKEENVGMQDVMRVWGSQGSKRLNDGAGPMMLLPKASRLLSHAHWYPLLIDHHPPLTKSLVCLQVDHPSMLTEIDHMIVSMHGRHRKFPHYYHSTLRPNISPSFP
ncbi:hypothetical protein QFC19_007343 [Naganishia cerealis]|uniref:Uncharacterized protein n=1 Tax=Naganishia cerealis TaxID=610337 RepID=A0ACC2VAW3_9TREE|nr:hypothetical protein QFC19_007343 [Naganishia cerealis]